MITFGKANFRISIETNGLHSTWNDPRVCWVVDYKLPSSGVMKANIENLLPLGSRDFVKFVISDMTDFLKAYEVYGALKKFGSCVNFAFSPVFGKMSPSQLIEWMKDYRIFDGMLNLQLHKIIYPDVDYSKEER